MMDVARANLLALEGGWRGFLDCKVGTGLGTDVNLLEAGLRQSLAEVLREHGRGKDQPATTYGPPRPGDLRSILLDARKIARQLGWHPYVIVANGLRRTTV